MSVTVLEALAAVLGLVGALFLAIGPRWFACGWLAFLASNCAGVAFAARTGHEWLLVQQIGFTCTSLLGIWTSVVQPRLQTDAEPGERSKDE
jgi:hypothetical protein